MAHAVIMPRQGQSVESCILTEWNKNVGDVISIGDIIFTCETDKASFEVEAEVAGTMLLLLAEEGDDVPCLDNVCVIGDKGEDVSEFSAGVKTAQETAPKEEVKQEVIKQAVSHAKPAESNDGKLKISPRAKNLAEKQSVDLSRAKSTGPNGRIIERDVASLAAQGIKMTSAVAGENTSGALGTGIGGAVTTRDLGTQVKSTTSAPIMSEFEDEPLSNVRKFIAKAMHSSLSEMAQLTIDSSFDATEILKFRAEVKASDEAMGIGSITMNDMILFAVAKTLKSHKACNAHYLGDKMRYFRDVNIGIAVDTDRGLLVPTLFNANNLSLNDLSFNAKEIIGQAKTGSISPDLLSGGTFTVTNLGALGVESFTPVINPPQTCILGVCTISEKVKTVNGEITTYPSMGLSLTFDHRAIDGAPAAMFLKDLVGALENFGLTLSK
jgi:pyruvate dehydrogenase E2 component (dihydrolipoamide acetyltransferase)